MNTTLNSSSAMARAMVCKRDARLGDPEGIRRDDGDSTKVKKPKPNGPGTLNPGTPTGPMPPAVPTPHGLMIRPAPRLAPLAF
jgi:hypothetical protein